VKRADQLHRRQSRHQRIAAGLTQQQPIILPVGKQIVGPDWLRRRAVLRQ